MQKTLYLASILRKCGSGLAGSDYNKQQKASNIVGIVFGVLIAAGLFILGLNLKSFEGFLGDSYIVMASLFMAATMVNVVLEIPGLIGNLYMGDDNQVLIGLPFTPVQIVAARVISSMVFPTAVAAIAVFPIGIGYIISNGATFSFILTLIFAFISIVLISMSFDVIVVVAIMSFVKVIRNKDSLRIIGAILLLIVLAAWIIFSYSFNNFNKETASALTNTLAQALWILPVNFAILQMFNGYIWLSLLEIIAITAAFVFVAFIISKYLYLNSVLKMQDTASIEGNVKDEDYKKLSKKTSIVMLIAKRDFYLTRRNPAHFTNSYLFPLVIPIVITIALLISGRNFADLLPLDSAEGSILMVAYITPIMTLCGSALGALSFTCISREGASFDMLRILPIPFEKIIKGKELVAFLVTGVPMAIISIIACLVGIIGFGMKAWIIPYSVVYSLLLSVFAIDRNMVRDMKSPNLVWDNEGLMIKNASGIRSVLIFFLGMVIAGISIFLCITRILAFVVIPFNILVSFILALLAHLSLNKWSKKVAKHLNM